MLDHWDFLQTRSLETTNNRLTTNRRKAQEEIF
jgi:hypothetical protein